MILKRSVYKCLIVISRERNVKWGKWIGYRALCSYIVMVTELHSSKASTIIAVFINLLCSVSNDKKSLCFENEENVSAMCTSYVCTHRSSQHYTYKVLHNNEVSWFSTAHTDPEWNHLVQKVQNQILENGLLFMLTLFFYL